MKKRILSMILALAMIVSVFAGVGVPAIAAEGYDYVKVSDAAQLAAGDVLLLVCEQAGKAAGAMGTGKFFTSQDAAFSGNLVTAENAVELTLGGEAGAWTLTSAEGLIGTSAAKALNHTGSGTTTWTITITDGDAAVTSTNTAYGSIQYNSSSPRFLNYASGQTAVQLYKKTASGTVCTHPNIAYTVTLAPSCTEEGQRSWSCPDCGETGVETIAALGHAWGEGEITVEPSCTEPGVRSFTCANDETHTKTETVPALGHTDENGDNVCDRCDAALSTADSYVLADFLREGDRIMFVFADAGSETPAPKAAGPLGGSGNSTYLSAVDAVLSDNTASSADALIFEVEAGTAAGTFAFKNNGKYLTASPAATGNNYLYLSAESSSADTDWTVSFSDGAADLAYAASTAANGRYIRYNQNATTTRFSGCAFAKAYSAASPAFLLTA